MDTRMVILGFLMHHRSMTGYDLKKAFSISFAFFSGISYGSIYPALKKMEHEGLIRMTVEVQDGTPNRKVYTITEAGKAAFMDSLNNPLPVERHKYNLLMKLFFFSYLDQEKRLSIVTEHLRRIEEMNTALRKAGPAIEAHADRYQYLCYEFGLCFYEDLARNISHVIDELKKE